MKDQKHWKEHLFYGRKNGFCQFTSWPTEILSVRSVVLEVRKMCSNLHSASMYDLGEIFHLI